MVARFPKNATPDIKVGRYDIDSILIKKTNYHGGVSWHHINFGAGPPLNR